MSGAELQLAMTMLVSLGSALGLTLAVELAVALAFRWSSARELAVLMLVNIATNPALNLLMWLYMVWTGSRSLFDPTTALLLGALEVLVVVVEWRLIAWALPERRGQALALSLVANGASLAVGLLVFGVS